MNLKKNVGGKNSKTNSRVIIWTKTKTMYFI